MDATLERELARCEPHVPFRATTGHRHHTWAYTYHSRPQLYLQPESTDEIQKIVTLARRCRKRIVTVGRAHSPSDLTCTSSWMVNLDHYAELLAVDRSKKLATMRAGIQLSDLCAALKGHGFALPTIGSISEQSIAGAIATGTHGSGLHKGLLSDYVHSFRIVLANGRVVLCSMEDNADLFRAGLVSLGALGIIIEITLRVVPDFKIRWQQSLVSQESVICEWEQGFWGSAEFERVWLFPYMKKCVRWQAHKTDESIQRPKPSWLSGPTGENIYYALLYVAHFFPRILPWIERFVVSVQIGGSSVSGVEEGMRGLQLNCLYSQFVNEWAIPLSAGPEALQRLSDWLHHDPAKARIPFESRGIWVHAPIEVRVVEASKRTYLGPTYEQDSLLLNATLYRPGGLDPPCHARYYQAFEWLMKDLGGRPHWAKNFAHTSGAEIYGMYPQMDQWLTVRHEVDPDGMFVGDWHRRTVLAGDKRLLPYALEERRVSDSWMLGGGRFWRGEVPRRPLSAQNSEESFDLMQAAETRGSVLLDFSESSSSEA